MENRKKYLSIIARDILFILSCGDLNLQAYYDGIIHGSKSTYTRFINPCTWENLDRQMMLLKLETAIGG